MPGTTIAVLALLVAVSLCAVALAYRRDTTRGWNALGLFAVGGVIGAYGLLAELLDAAAPIAVGVGGVVAAAGLALLLR